MGEKDRKYEFVFATHKIIDTNIYPAQLRRVSDDALFDIGYDGSVIDISEITAKANGGEARYSGLYDQTERLPMIGKSNKSYQPLATDNAFNGLNYLNDNSQATGLTIIDDFDIRFDKDMIVHYIFRNETNNNNQRFNLAFSSSKSGGGVFVLGVRGSSSNYIIGFTLTNGLIYTSQYSQRRAVISKGNTVTNFTLFTFSKIGGIYKFHRNGLEITLDSVDENVGNPLINIIPSFRYGLSIGSGASNDLNSDSGKINDFKGVLVKSGDLSTFDLSNHILDIMNKFGI